MRLTLDWDSDELKEMHLPAVKEGVPANENQRRVAQYTDVGPSAEKWELWKSSSHGVEYEGEEGEGWHYIEYDLDGTLDDMRSNRTAYGDDRLRITLDGKRIEWGSPFISVLYHYKQIRPEETGPPYQTPRQAELVERHGYEDQDQHHTKRDGRVDYGALVDALAEHPDFGSRAAVYRRVMRRPSVEIGNNSTDRADYARRRAYDVAKGRRSPQPAEAKALRDYAQARGIGHYGTDETEPQELAEKPHRTTFHEGFRVPQFELGTGAAFDRDPGESIDSDSEWYQGNVRTGTYGDGVDEMTLKQIHDKIMYHFRDVLAPSSTTTHPDGTTTTHGFEEPIQRRDYDISLEQDRPLDKDEAARYRRVWRENQPGTPAEDVLPKCDRKGINPWSEDAVHWELIIYEGEQPFSGDIDYWWIARGVLDASDPEAVRSPIANSAIVADTQGWL